MMPGLLLLLPLVLFQDSVIDLTADPALQKKVTLAIKGQPVNDAIRELGKGAGVSAMAVQNIWDLKVTVFCKDEPAGPVMQQLANVLGAEWTKDGEVYRLGFGRLAQQQRSAFEQGEARLMRERIEKGMVAYTQLAAVNPNAPKPSAESKPRIDALTKDPSAILFGQMLGSMSSSQAAAFWRGEVRTYVPQSPARADSSPVIPDESKRIVARFDPYLVSVERNPGRDASLITSSLILFERPVSALASMPFARDLLGWPAGSEIPANDPRFKKSASNPTSKASDFFVRRPVMDDHLEALHRSTGVAVVGDSFSVPQTGAAGGGDVQGWVNSVRSMRSDAKVSAGVVGVRHRGFWRLRQFELPDSQVAFYEQLAKIEPLTLDHYAALAGRLKPAHASALMLENAVSLNFDTTPFSAMMPALQFYGQLTPAQKRQAHSGLDATTLTDAQKRAFVDVLLWGVLKGKGRPTTLYRAMQGDLAEMGLVVAEETFESGLKDKRGKAILKGRKFHMHFGTRSQPVRFEAYVAGPEPE